jgi:hypothetical protein
MKTLLLIVASVVTVAAVPASAQSASPQAPTAYEEYTQRIERAKEQMTLRLRELQLAARVKRATGGLLSADRIEATANGVSAQGNVRLTFNGGAIAAGAVVIQDDGVVRVLGDSQVTLTPSR